jgi:TonB family protein
MGTKNLLLKSFFVSLLVHAAGISLFSLILPMPLPERKPIEVSLLPPSAAPEKIELAATVPMPEQPKPAPKSERLALARERKTVKIATERFTGTPQYVPVTQVSRKFDIPEFQVKLPDIISFKITEKSFEKKPAGVDIEGPAGDRGLVYRQQADYPEWAQEKDIEGNVQIKFWVDPDGKIALTSLLGSSGFPELDVYAEQIFRKWLFEPVKTDKQAWGIITFRFRLQ